MSEIGQPILFEQNTFIIHVQDTVTWQPTSYRIVSY